MERVRRSHFWDCWSASVELCWRGSVRKLRFGRLGSGFFDGFGFGGGAFAGVADSLGGGFVGSGELGFEVGILVLGVDDGAEVGFEGFVPAVEGRVGVVGGEGGEAHALTVDRVGLLEQVEEVGDGEGFEVGEGVGFSGGFEDHFGDTELLGPAADDEGAAVGEAAGEDPPGGVEALLLGFGQRYNRRFVGGDKA